MRLVIIAGMPGAGKSIIATAFREMDFPIIVMGDIIREETQKRGLAATPANTKKVMLELRERDGLGAVAKCCLEELEKITSDIIVIEGCRSIAEIDVFDDYATGVTIVCVHSSPSIRFARLQDRGRDDDPLDWTTFRERDLREISVGLGGVIALADWMLINEGSVDEILTESRELAKRLT